ncbi:MAG: serine/threonine-protein kinase [Kofleriaceae bacterium]
MLDRIAVGGMAEVFLAKAYGAHGFEKTLAIKRILPELARDPEFAARFIAEAKVAVKLSHANVVQVFDFGRIGDALFIAMEYVDGLDLALLIRKFKDEKRQIPLPAAFHIAIEIIRALDFAHQHGVVHRDVSPSNILISRAGEVKIGDFGIAVAAAPHKAGGPGIRKVMGKWRYMSPEQTRGDTLDTRSDLFSAASVLFELFTAEKLFPGDEAEDIIKNIESMPIPRASSVRPGLPSRLDEILAGPLSRKPIDRPTRPAQMLRSLIELSYESSIMATALDVAEAVASVLPAKRISGTGHQLDDFLRKQIGQAQQEGSVARRTAVTDNKPPGTATMDRGEHSTGLFRKIGGDGVSELSEIDVDPTGVAPPRHTEPMVKSPDSGLHRLLEKVDNDRRTEPGAPPTGAAPKIEPPALVVTNTGGKSITTFTGEKRGRLWLSIGAIIAVGAGLIVWRVTSGKPEQIVVPVVKDAAPQEPKGVLAIDPGVDGANGTITDSKGVEYPFGPTTKDKPTRLKVDANVKLHVHAELTGFAAFDTDVTVAPDETMRLTPKFTRERAGLHVTTTPPGASVSLDHKLLGETPFKNDSLDPAVGVTLEISKSGYEPVRQKIDLVIGHPMEIDETLKTQQRFGMVKLSFSTGWGDVTFKGQKIGNNSRTMMLKLPVGRQTLHIKNPPSGKQWDWPCDVVENVTTTCITQLPK